VSGASGPAPGGHCCSPPGPQPCRQPGPGVPLISCTRQPAWGYCGASTAAAGDTSAGPRRALQLYTKEGVYLAELAKRPSWVWCARARPKSSAIACGCEDGSIALVSVTLGTEHALHGERYAVRENMTDVVVQHLITEQKVRIRCK
jgi:hypothetical protein